MLSHRMYGTKTYRTWDSMIQRCYNPKTKGFKRYGGRGISVCADWLSFESFYKDMGKKPDGATIDRANNNGNYGPANCQWATPKEQANNRRSNIRIMINGSTKTLMQWCEMLGFKYSTAYFRYKKGLPVNMIFLKVS